MFSVIVVGIAITIIIDIQVQLFKHKQERILAHNERVSGRARNQIVIRTRALGISFAITIIAATNY